MILSLFRMFTAQVVVDFERFNCCGLSEEKTV
jgi:hypothetical protein